MDSNLQPTPDAERAAGSMHRDCSAARERVVEAEGIIAGILYESSNLTIGACQGKAARILGALRAVGWDHENSKPPNAAGERSLADSDARRSQ
jgi:hypothetical protein